MQPNKIKGKHIKVNEQGKKYLYPKEYIWHIPKDMRKKIEVGDKVEVIGSKDLVRVIDLFFADEPKNHQAIYRIVKKRKLSFSEQLKNFRKKHKLTQTELGQLLGVSLNTITGWEREKSLPQKRYHSKIEEKLNIKVSDYLDTKK